MTSETVVRETVSICPHCGRRMPARIVLRGNDLFMLKNCPEHGESEAPFWRDHGFYREVSRIVGHGSDGVEWTRDFHDFQSIRGILIDLTTRCNLNCKNCFTNANQVEVWEPTLEEILERLGRIRGRKPVLFLQGGEPTLRADLPAILRTLIGKGYVIKLVTNGLKLVDEGYVRELKETGLEWVFLQFDGLSDQVSEEFRGRPLVAVKQKALKNLVRQRFKVLLAVMVERGVNLAETGSIFQIALDTPHVQQISFLPASRIGRRADVTGDDITTALDVMEELERWTGGRLGRADFLAFLRIARALHKLTGNPDYKPKSCFFPMVLHHRGGRVTPLNRFLDPRRLVSEPRAAPDLLSMLPHLMRLDNSPANPHLLTLCIEHFRDPRNIDLLDAFQCNKVYMTREGYSRSCVYNSLQRQTRGCGAANPAAKDA